MRKQNYKRIVFHKKVTSYFYKILKKYINNKILFKKFLSLYYILILSSKQRYVKKIFFLKKKFSYYSLKKKQMKFKYISKLNKLILTYRNELLYFKRQNILYNKYLMFFFLSINFWYNIRFIHFNIIPKIYKQLLFFKYFLSHIQKRSSYFSNNTESTVEKDYYLKITKDKFLKQFKRIRFYYKFSNFRKNKWYIYRMKKINYLKRIDGLLKKKLLSKNVLSFENNKAVLNYKKTRRFISKYSFFKFRNYSFKLSYLKYFKYLFFSNPKEFLSRYINLTFNNIYIRMKTKKDRIKNRKLKLKMEKIFRKKRKKKIITLKQKKKEKYRLMIEKENKKIRERRYKWNRIKHLFKRYLHKYKKAPYMRKSNRYNLVFNKIWVLRKFKKKLKDYQFKGLFFRNKVRHKVKKKIILRVLFSKYFKVTINRLSKWQRQFKSIKYFVNSFFSKLEFILIRLNYVTNLILSRLLIWNNYVFINGLLCNNINFKISIFDTIELANGFDFYLFKYMTKSIKKSKWRKIVFKKHYFKCIRMFYFTSYVNKYTNSKFMSNFINDPLIMATIWLNKNFLHSLESNKIINRRILNFYINSKSFY